MKPCLNVLFVMLIAWGAPLSQADTLVPDFPSWWKVPGDPADGVTRTQYHAFHDDPNDPTNHWDWEYNGFTPSISDQWDVGAISDYGQDETFISPFKDSQGTRHGDIWGKAAVVDTPGSISKLMGNLSDPSMVKLFHVEIIWVGDNPDAVTLGVDAPGSTVQITDSGVISAAPELYAHNLAYIDGTISPQPDSETFTFTFSEGVMIDSIYIGTHCVPEPATLSLLGLAGAALMRRRRR